MQHGLCAVPRWIPGYFDDILWNHSYNTLLTQSRETADDCRSQWLTAMSQNERKNHIGNQYFLSRSDVQPRLPPQDQGPSGPNLEMPSQDITTGQEMTHPEQNSELSKGRKSRLYGRIKYPDLRSVYGADEVDEVDEDPNKRARLNGTTSEQNNVERKLQEYPLPRNLGPRGMNLPQHLQHQQQQIAQTSMQHNANQGSNQGHFALERQMRPLAILQYRHDAQATTVRAQQPARQQQPQLARSDALKPKAMSIPNRKTYSNAPSPLPPPRFSTGCDSNTNLGWRWGNPDDNLGTIDSGDVGSNNAKIRVENSTRPRVPLPQAAPDTPALEYSEPPRTKPRDVESITQEESTNLTRDRTGPTLMPDYSQAMSVGHPSAIHFASKFTTSNTLRLPNSGSNLIKDSRNPRYAWSSDDLLSCSLEIPPNQDPAVGTYVNYNIPTSTKHQTSSVVSFPWSYHSPSIGHGVGICYWPAMDENYPSPQRSECSGCVYTLCSSFPSNLSPNVSDHLYSPSTEYYDDGRSNL